MATARAIANGNWNSTNTWNGNAIPGNGDTVYANGFNVTLDVDVNIGGANNPIVNTGSLVSGQWYEITNVGGQNWTTIGAASNTLGTVFQSTGTGTAGNLGTARAIATLTTATNTAAGATTGGGSFVMSTIRAMTCDLRAGTTTCLNVAATSGTLTLSGIRAVGGSAAGAHALNTTANTELQSGCTFTGGFVGSANALNNASTGSVTVSGSCTFTGGTAFALNNASTGSVTVNGSCTFTGGTSGNAHGLNNASTGSVTVNGSCTFTGGTSANANALNNASTGSVTINGSCTFTGGNNANANGLNNASTGSVTVSKSTFTASAFTNAVSVANTSADVRLSGDFLDHWSGWKAVSGGKWRLGTTPTAARTRYALDGTTDSYVTMFTADNTGFGLPAANHVRSGISYGGGAVTGTCAVPGPDSVALGIPIDATTGTAVLTPAAIRSELSVELGRIDAAISSRLAPSGTLATVTNLTNAPASVTPADIWSHATRTLTSASGPTAVQIRQEMDSNSTQLAAIKAKTDNLPAAPAAVSNIPTATENASAVWAKPTTELTITGSIGERSKNQSTVSTTGAQLAAALS